MTKRRSRGEGSIFFLPEKGLWVSKITLPDGRRKVKYGKRQGPLREYHHTALNQMRQGFLPKDDKITISDFLDNYMETVGRHYLRPRTVEMYSSLIKVHIKPTIGRVKISDLRPDHLQTLYDQKVKSGLSKRTVQLIHSTLRTALKKATIWGLITRNPCNFVQAPKPGKRSPTWYKKDQLKTFLDVLKYHRWYPIYVLLVYGGLREGEVLGLHVEDCDMANRVINIRHAIITLKGGLVIGEPKTETSKRVVSLPQFAYDELSKHLEQLQRKSGLIFTTSSGKPISPRNLIRRFKQALKEAGLPDIRIQDLRHSHASLLLAAGTNPKIVQERLGHASITLTLDTYSHVIPSLQSYAADKVDEIMRD